MVFIVKALLFCSIPSVIKFAPAGALPTDVELFIRTPTSLVSLGQSYLSNGKVNAGRIDFKSLSLGLADHTPTSHDVELLAVLTATVNGESITSNPVPLTIDDQYSAFTPMYLADNVKTYNAAARFGTHNELGGDSWATHGMLNWLTQTVEQNQHERNKMLDQSR